MRTTPIKLLVVLVLFVCGACSGSVPLPPEFTPIGAPDVIEVEGATVTHSVYSSSMSPPELHEFYETHLESPEWKLIKDGEREKRWMSGELIVEETTLRCRPKDPSKVARLVVVVDQEINIVESRPKLAQ